MEQLETEHERVFPFDPLHCSTIPTVPGARLDQELEAENGNAGALQVPFQIIIIACQEGRVIRKVP